MSVQTLTKQPSESRQYAMEFAPMLEPGETLTAVSSVAATPTGLTLVGPAAFSGSVAQQRISGGTDAVTYKVTFVVTTTDGNTLEAEGYLRVKAL